MKKNLLLFTFIIMNLIFSFPSQAQQCVCEDKTEELRFEEAHAVFSGESLSKTENTTTALWNTLSVISIEKADETSKGMIDSFEINGIKKAKIAQKISECNYAFSEGKHYRVFATVKLTQKGTPYFTTNICAGTKEIEATKGTAQNEQAPASGNNPEETNGETKSTDEQNATEN